MTLLNIDDLTIPDGWYEVECEKAEVKLARVREMRYLTVRLRIIYGAQKDMTLHTFFVLWGDNPRVVEMSRQRLRQFCNACGFLLTVEDSDDLIGSTLLVKVVDGRRVTQFTYK